MATVTVNEEKRVSNVTIEGTNISLVGDVIRDLDEKVERISVRIQSHADVNAFIGDVSYVKNHDERNTVTYFINCLPEYLEEATELGNEAIKQIINQ